MVGFRFSCVITCVIATQQLSYVQLYFMADVVYPRFTRHDVTKKRHGLGSTAIQCRAMHSRMNQPMSKHVTFREGQRAGQSSRTAVEFQEEILKKTIQQGLDHCCNVDRCL